MALAFCSQQYRFLSYLGYTAMAPWRAQCNTVLKDSKGRDPQRGQRCGPRAAGGRGGKGCPWGIRLALSAALTFLCGLHGMEECQGPLAAGRGLGVTALLPRQVQLGIGERHFRHGVKYLQV